MNIFEFSYANALFASDACKLNEEIGSLTLLEQKLQLEKRNCNSDLHDPALIINEYVMKKTNSRLLDFVAEKDWKMEAKTIALVNAMHLRAEFVLSLLGIGHKVKNDIFTLDDGSSIKAIMLTEEMPTGYGVIKKLGGAKLLRLDYADGWCRTFIVLPNTKGKLNNVDKLLSRLTGEILRKAIADLKERVVRLQIPKFRLDQSYDMMPVFREMGLTFTPEIVIQNASCDTLQMRNAFQKTSLGIAESGTEEFFPFPGQTAMIWDVGDRKFLRCNMAVAPCRVGGWNDKNPVTFNAVHPFCLFLQHLKTGAILYAGVIREPQF